MTNAHIASKRLRKSNTYCFVQLVNQPLIGCEGKLMELHKKLPKKHFLFLPDLFRGSWIKESSKNDEVGK